MTEPPQGMVAAGCPVCQARFRGSRVCSRCGADLGPLMILAGKAWRLRESARAAITTGDVARARELAGAAQEAQWTREGEALQRVSAWLGA